MDVQCSYDAAAAAYAERYAGELAHKPLDRALLAAFADMLGPGAPVLDAGCGPGHVTAHLARLGLSARGLDLSPAMVEQAHRLHPAVTVAAGSMLDLDDGDATLRGITAFYSIIHFDDDQLRRVASEFARVLDEGGLLLLAFHVGDEVRHASELCGAAVDLDFRFHRTDDIAHLLDTAGFTTEAVLQRSAYTPHEVDTRRGYVLARRT